MDLLKLIRDKNPRTIGIDGNSGAGKTTLAQSLASALCGTVIPFDLFHKQERRFWDLNTDMNDFGDTEKLSGVIARLLNGESFGIDKLYNHTDGTFSRSFHFEPKPVLIVEGLCVMKLPLDFKIFLHVDPVVALGAAKSAMSGSET
jgi:uridine kinase